MNDPTAETYADKAIEDLGETFHTRDLKRMLIAAFEAGIQEEKDRSYNDDSPLENYPS